MEQARITNQQPSQGHQAVRGKQPSQARDAAGQAQDSGSGGFLSLLAALGDGVLQDGTMLQDGGLVLEASEPVVVDGAAEDVPLSWPWMTALSDQALPTPTVDSTAMPGFLVMQTVGPLAEQLTVQSAKPLTTSVNESFGINSTGPLATPPETQAVGLGGWSGAHGMRGALASLETLPQNGLVAQTAVLDSAVPLRQGTLENGSMDASLAAAPGGVRRLPTRVNGGLVSAGGLPITAGTQGAQALKSQVGMKDLSAMQAAQAVAGQNPVAEHHSAVALVREGARLAGQDQTPVPGSLAPLVTGFSEGGGRSSAPRSGDQGGSAATGFGAYGGNAETQGMASVETGAAVFDPGMAGTEDAVAEQVAFWVRQNIQNAEMTIQHDGQAVEVSVSLTGNEAHVSFGSDQAETRSLLDGSVAQLREMLRQEGLSLSGVTVGESGQRQGSEESGRSNQQSLPRKTVVEVPAPLQTGPRSGASHQTDRSIDIFV